jgi:hypothetical protein
VRSGGRRIDELVRSKGVPLPREFLRAGLDKREVLTCHPARLRARRLRHKHDLGPEGSHHAHALTAISFGHDCDERVAAYGTHDGKSGAGIAAGQFDDGLAWP